MGACASFFFFFFFAVSVVTGVRYIGFTMGGMCLLLTRVAIYVFVSRPVQFAADIASRRVTRCT